MRARSRYFRISALRRGPAAAAGKDKGIMKISDIKEAAESRLAGYTGFRRPRAVGVDLADGLYRVKVEIVESSVSGPAQEVLRTYVVAVDADGVCHGYAPAEAGPGEGIK